MLKRTCPGRIFFAMLCLYSLLGFASQGIASEQAVKDLAYGGVLFEYHQGHAFAALSQLKVAQKRGGIKGHGDHPQLIESGLLLTYGMTNEARQLLETLLLGDTSTVQLSASQQQIAWFYLGKVFYLENSQDQALSSFAHIDMALLKEQDREKYYELVYLKAQILFTKAQMAGDAQPAYTLDNIDLPEGHVYRFYLIYNQAVHLLAQQNKPQAIAVLQALVSRLTRALELPLQDTRLELSERLEQAELRNQSLLTLAQLQLNEQDYEAALLSLQGMQQDSLFSEQGLFLYALAASQLGRYELALNALQTLQQRPLFNPWLQQTPYALAYLYEQMNEPDLALAAYRSAVELYQTQQNKLINERAGLSEVSVLDALALTDKIGTERVVKDAYGRIRVQLQQFTLAALLASEDFLRQLSELHELYVLKNSLTIWDQQLISFEAMLETRLAARRDKLNRLQASLEELAENQWQQKAGHFNEHIQQALDARDARYFMSTEQLAYARRLERSAERLAALPDSHPDKATYQQRLQRVQAYFTWWIEDEFSINRWRTQKAQADLNQKMAQFEQRHARLQSVQEMDDEHQRLTRRLTDAQGRLANLSLQLEHSLHTSRQHLLAQVDTALAQTLAQVTGYLVASREALARVSDSLLDAGSPHSRQEGAQ